jgi:TraE protein
MQLDKLHDLIKHLKNVVYLAVVPLGLLSVFLAVMNYNALELVGKLSKERPIMVVPGAVAGQYISGLGEENLIGAARYVASLGTSFTSSSYDERAKELLAYASPGFEPVLKASQLRQRDEVQATGQARAFNFDRSKEKMARIDANTFQYSASAERIVYAAGLIVSQDEAQIAMTFKLGISSEKNRYGLTVTGLEVSNRAQGTAQELPKVVKK